MHAYGPATRLRLIAAYAVGALLLWGCSTSPRVDRNALLIRAAEKGETNRMVMLIREGADINAVDKEGWTPYLAASTYGRFDAMKLLKILGAKTEPPESETPWRFNLAQ